MDAAGQSQPEQQQQIITKRYIPRPEIVKLGDRTIEVDFKVLTICVVTEDGKQIGIGTTQWSPSDDFDYDRGKKLALRQAIKCRSDGFRADFWAAYLSAARQHLQNRVAEHKVALRSMIRLSKAIAFELNEDLGKLKRGVFGCPKR